VAQAAAAASGVPGALDARMAEGIEGLLDMGLFRPRSREQEFEADAIGVELCKRGGFVSPNGSLRVFQCFDALTRARMGGVSQQQQAFLNFLSTHPTPRDRAIAVSDREQLALGAGR
jgi:predicted Zn-dependent protease